MSHFNVAGLKEQLLELHETMNEPDFWNDLKRSTEVSRKVRITENKVEHYEKLCQRADDVDTTMELAEEMQDTDLLAEAGEADTRSIEHMDDLWVVSGKWMQQLIADINFADYESRMYFDRQLRKSGLFDRLEEMGIEDGDTVSIYDFEFEYER